MITVAKYAFFGGCSWELGKENIKRKLTVKEWKNKTKSFPHFQELMPQ